MQNSPMQGMKRGSEGQASGTVKRPRSDDNRDVTLRVLLQSKSAGGIIGKGGQNIKRLRTDYGASVSVPDSNTSERVLSVQAQEDIALDVLKECLPQVGPPPYAGGPVQGINDSQFEIDFLIHSSQAGGVIGRAGFKIKELRERSGALIKVFGDCLPLSTERVIAIGGSGDQILTTLKDVLEIMADNPIKGPIQLYDPSLSAGNDYDMYQPQFSSGGPPARGGMGPRGGRGGGPRGGRGGQGGGFGRGGGGQGGFGRGRGRGGGGGSDFDFKKQSGGSDGQQGFAQPLIPTGDNNYTDFGGQGGGEGGPNMNNPDTNGTQVTIPKDLAGAIIGRGGERIRNIRQRSGADIKIEDPKPDAKDRVISINGNQEQVQYAQFLMQQSVRMYSGQQKF